MELEEFEGRLQALETLTQTVVENVLSGFAAIDQEFGNHSRSIDLQGQLSVSTAVFVVAKLTGKTVPEAFEEFKKSVTDVAAAYPDGYTAENLAEAFMRIE